MARKQTIEEEINSFLEVWGYNELASFLKEIIPLLKLYDTDNEDDWVRREVGESNEINVRLIRTVYLLSRIAEFHSGKLCSTSINFKGLWKRMEKYAERNS